MGKAVRARACANIALVKYWGKRDDAQNIPAAGSLSLTLDALTTETSLRFDPELAKDELILDGELARAAERKRVSRFLDLVRARVGETSKCRISSDNAFPTASGLASSASGFAALAVAASTAAGLELSPRELSILARRGSGSAARSLFGGFVRMHAGDANDGSDSYAEPIAGAADWDLAMTLCVVDGGGRKAVSSREAMNACRATSPLYEPWLASVPADLREAEAAIVVKDFERLGAVTERSTLTMHASALAARPGICFWTPATIACMNAVKKLRAGGTLAFFTMDAGPHVKVLSAAADSTAVAAALGDIDGVSQMILARPGPGARIL